MAYQRQRAVLCAKLQLYKAPISSLSCLYGTEKLKITKKTLEDSLNKVSMF